MARTIRTTWRKLKNHLADNYADRAVKRAVTRRLKAEIATKRLLKEQVALERRHARPDVVVDPTAVPIVFEPDGEHVHACVTAEDLVAVLRRLAPGVIDGVSEIRIGLGMHVQSEIETDEDDDEGVDPLTGRAPSHLILPGVHAGSVYGLYRADPASIYLCSFVYDGALANRTVKELYLRMFMLGTFVHEVAHHHDYRERVARGRWRADHRGQKENYAEHQEHAWVRSAVIPYLEEAYAGDIATLRSWFIEHVGAEVPLDVLAGDLRVTRRDGQITGRLTSIRSAFVDLVEAVETGKDPYAIRIGFATGLWFANELDAAHAVLTAVRAVNPRDPEALTLLSRVVGEEHRHAEAEAHARAALAEAPTSSDAWLALLFALRPQLRWADLVEAARQALTCPDLHYGDLISFATARARAHLELGAHAALEHDLIGLALGPIRGARSATVLRAIQLLRRGELAAALAFATEHAAHATHDRVELAAVRFEAAHRLGHPTEAHELSEAQRNRLRALDYGAWVDRLVALGAR